MKADVIVIGLGAMGSAAVYQLAKGGARVCGIDRYSPPHTLGSTHGDTRITRLAIGEGEQFVPFAIRSHEIWRELESESGARLMTTTGGLITSPAKNYHPAGEASAPLQGHPARRCSGGDPGRKEGSLKDLGTADGEREPPRQPRSITSGLPPLLRKEGSFLESPAASSHELHGSSNFLETTISAAKKFGINHRVLKADEIAAEFPQFVLDGDEKAYFEDEAGFLRPELCVATQLSLAEKLGAAIRRNERVLRVEKDGPGVKVTTDIGTYSAATAIISAGPWVADLIGGSVAGHFKVYRQVLYWFDVSEAYERYALGAFPIFIWSFGRFAGDFVYGFPAINGPGGGMKLASEEYEITTSPEQVDRAVTDEEAARIFRTYVSGKLAGIGERCVRSAVCLYTSTADSNFVIDWVDENVLLASPCSGHGFKHSAAIGETLAELALTRTSRIDISPFSIPSL